MVIIIYLKVLLVSTILSGAMLSFNWISAKSLVLFWPEVIFPKVFIYKLYIHHVYKYTESLVQDAYVHHTYIARTTTTLKV